MKIAVYCITKNEESFIAKWAASAAEADYRVVVDTGSTDGTVEAARLAGCTVHQIVVSPWRFDTARNASLALIPGDADLCVALDADEVLTPGWREALETVPDHVTRPRYNYIWSWSAPGVPGLSYSGDKIHRRHGYTWTHPVHEVLTPTGVPEVQSFVPGLEIHHFPDSTKSRAQYLPLLELAVAERPEDDRNAHYLGREYVYQGQFDKAEAELKRHLALPSAKWAPERAKSMRLLAQCLPHEAEAWLLKAAAECPTMREQWLALARFYYQKEQWPQCYGAVRRCLEIEDRNGVYLNEAECWGWEPHDLAALSSYNLGLYQEAVQHGLRALLNSDDTQQDRLTANLGFYQRPLTLQLAGKEEADGHQS